MSAYMHSIHACMHLCTCGMQRHIGVIHLCICVYHICIHASMLYTYADMHVCITYIHTWNAYMVQKSQHRRKLDPILGISLALADKVNVCPYVMEVCGFFT